MATNELTQLPSLESGDAGTVGFVFVASIPLLFAAFGSWAHAKLPSSFVGFGTAASGAGNEAVIIAVLAGVLIAMAYVSLATKQRPHYFTLLLISTVNLITVLAAGAHARGAVAKAGRVIANNVGPPNPPVIIGDGSAMIWCTLCAVVIELAVLGGIGWLLLENRRQREYARNLAYLKSKEPKRTP